ncbi:uncharacterized protein LOC129599062 isoform X2 [Paramacrobiotus metropolitanus]|uniref:uncharacterized protein LOC129599062 isoform X2 n=1 Tax=Paramacrobiotus metropolitanus TaxID=2943436 RepID=UPI002445F3C3|nr:uncharacterized protein LOC129599062 isoform X2 [Paramacrobiotus metropolitanus]
MSRTSAPAKSPRNSGAMSESLIDLLGKLDERFGTHTYVPTSGNKNVFDLIIPVIRKLVAESSLLSARVTSLESENSKLKKELDDERQIRAGGDADLLKSDEDLKGHIHQIDLDQKQDVGTLDDKIEGLKESHNGLLETVNELVAWKEAATEEPEIIEITNGGEPGYGRQNAQPASTRRSYASVADHRREFWKGGQEITIASPSHRRFYGNGIMDTENGQTDHVLIIRPTDIEEAENTNAPAKPDPQTVRAFKSALQEHIPCESRTFALKNVKPGYGKSVIMTFPTRADYDKGKAEITKRSESLKCSVSEPKKKMPRLIVRKVDKAVTKTEFLEKLIIQNSLEYFRENLKIVVKLESGNESINTCAFVIETSSGAADYLLKRGKVTIDFELCPVEEHFHVIQCGNCCRYGHRKETCTFLTQCGFCIESHRFENCNCNWEDTPKCVNCVSSGKQTEENPHHAFDHKRCPVYHDTRVKVSKILKSRTFQKN